MTKNGKIISLVAALFILSANALIAQQDFVWDHYKVALTLPNDFKVIKNTDNEFECDGDAMHLYMYVYEDEQVDFKEMVKATKELAKKLNFEVTDEVHNFKDDGFEGRYVLGTKDGRQIMLCGLINQNSAANFWIAIEYEENDPVAEKDGIAILNSIRQH